MTDSDNKILYVEDEEDIRTVARISLETVGGFIVKICASGKEALQVVEDFKPDLILLDVMMPDMDGPATLLEIRKIASLKNVPAAFMTAKVQANEIEHFYSLGAVDVIPKPFDPMTLAERVGKLLKKEA
ncbi:MAG: response regulator [Proteobacteria bacterium]|nr:response regulator [Pseudomonadota bacterium]NOG61762.1 response regulator [Pseudomonadota bacterium]